MAEVNTSAIPCLLRAVEESVGPVFRIGCPPLATLGTTEFEALANALAVLMLDTVKRAGDNATIVLEVMDATIVPAYVDLAIGQLVAQRARLGLIVVCGDETSHDADSSLPQALREAIGKLSHGGTVWDPLHQRSVPAWPAGA